MKKVLVLASIVGIMGFGALAAKADVNNNGATPAPQTAKVTQDNKKEFPPKRKHCCKKDFGTKIDKELKITADQKKQIEQLRQTTHEEMKPLMEQMRTEGEKYRALKEKGASEAELKAQKDKMKPLFEQAQKSRMEHMQKFEAILTSEQKTKFEKIKAENKKNFEKRKFNHKHGDRPFGEPPFGPGPGQAPKDVK